MSSPAETITVNGHGPSETFCGAIRSFFCVAGFCFIVYIDHSVSKYAIGGIALVASPALARAVIAPMLAKILKTYGPSGTDPMLTQSGKVIP
jgi:hypothetical protein